MVELRLSRLCAALAFLLVCTSLLVASCSTPEFKFVDNSQPAHCQNTQLDEGESDKDCGGACPPCELTQHCNSASDCREGECMDGTCQAAGCNDGSQTDNETGIDCGGGGCKPCPVGSGCSVETDCQTGVCGDDQLCAEASCEDRVPNGDETDIDCGGPSPDCARCGPGQNCLTPSDCVSNECSAEKKCVISCASGFGNCDGISTNLCETNLRTNPDHCGDCTTACSLLNAKASCVGGVCRVESCTPPFEDCNGNPEDGCETNTTTNLEHCGACDAKPCPTLNGQPYCRASSCGLDCKENFADCDGLPNNGCERDVSRDINNCGGCSQACTASPGKTAWCRNGQCGETTCPAGRGDCNGNPDDDPQHAGCETDLKTDLDNCAACGTACGISGGDAQCTAGVCSVKSCSPGLADCTGGYADGCETNSNTDVKNCGACGKTCNVANGSALCLGGTCQLKGCTGTFADCNGNPTDGCESNTLTSQTHCGACSGAGTNCDTEFANASGQCMSGVCSLKTCATDYANCDKVPNNGCESNLKTDEEHCGSCTIACSGAGSTGPNCAAGVCAPQCTGTLISCSNPQNGCVIDSATDENNCGGCNKVCDNSASAHVGAAGNQCVAKVCKPSCLSLYSDCDGDPKNGCERAVVVDGTCLTHLDIGVVGTAVTAKSGFESGAMPTALSTTHTLTNSKASGRYRMVLVGVTGSEPYKLTTPATLFALYNNIAMHPAIEANTNEQGSYAGIFYLLDSELPANSGSYPVKVQFSPGAQNGSGAFTVSEFQNVQQTGTPPFVTTVASPSDSNCGNPSTRGVTLSFSQAGSFGYAVIAARSGTGAMATPGTVVETMNLIQGQPFPLAGLAGYVGPINGTSTPSWTVSNCPNSAGVGVVLKRVGD